MVDWFAVVVCAGAFVALQRFGIGVVAVLLASGVAGVGAGCSCSRRLGPKRPQGRIVTTTRRYRESAGVPLSVTLRMKCASLGLVTTGAFTGTQ